MFSRNGEGMLILLFVPMLIYSSQRGGFVAEFSFLTKCWSQHLQAKFEAIQLEDQSPDVIVINSLLWDICR